MIYAVCVLIVAIFACLILFFKPKLREKYCETIWDSNEYSAACENYLRSFSLPKKSGKQLSNWYVSSIKSGCRMLNRRKNRELFANIIQNSVNLRLLCKKNYDLLENLPSVDGVPRVVLIADFCLNSTGFEYNGERIAATLNIQNNFKTLCYSEILALNTAFYYSILKKTAIIINNCKILAKMKRIADKNKNSPEFIKTEKCYNQLKDSKLFLSFCADNVSFQADECYKAREEFLTSYSKLLDVLSCTLKNVERTDFSVFYSPLQIFAKYEAFESATEEEKSGFLSMTKRLSDKENIDEFLFAIRIDNYLKSANVGHIKVFRAGMFNNKFSCVVTKESISTLALALSSSVMMSLIFGSKNRNKSNSIQNIGEFENSFAKISKFQTINFGICLKNDKLKLSPNLPRCVEQADLQVVCRGTRHKVHIRRGEEKALYLENTKLSGTSIIKLPDKPLDITCILPKEQ